MGLYDRFVLPVLLECTCGSRPIAYQRRKVVPQAKGRVLEVGMGSGLNLPYYDAGQVERVFGLDPAGHLLAKAERRAAGLGFPVEPLALAGEEIPLEDRSVDTVLVTYALCTIPGVGRALGEMRRVLKPEGRLLFCEHGLAPDPDVQAWQHRLNPLWRRIGGGCNLDRDMPTLIGKAGFRIERLESMYLPKTPRFAGFNVWGTAAP